jgi:RNA polymerase sigma-70 factor (ECF subfamily)
VSPLLALSVPDDDPDLFADLIERIAAQGDRAAFARLFAYFAPRLKSWLLRRGQTPEAAESEAIAVMAAVWRQAARFDPRRDVASAWIFRILRNVILETTGPQRETPGCAVAPLAVRGRPRPIRPQPRRQPAPIQPRNAALISRG